MGKPILLNRESAPSPFGGGGFYSAARQNADQMRTILGAAVQVAVQTLGWHRQPFERLGRETLLQRLLESGDAKHTVGAGAGDRNADIRRTLGHEPPDQRIARGLVTKLDVGGL